MWSIVSAAPEHEISQYLRKQKWFDLFEDGIYGAPRSKEKIFDEEYNRETLEGSTVFLGDSESDLKVAKLFNIDFIFVKKWSRDPWLADKEGVNYVESVEEFLRKV
jgi:phosphoglycolate phosphatase-like HAD superfamily hydrolase